MNCNETCTTTCTTTCANTTCSEGPTTRVIFDAPPHCNTCAGVAEAIACSKCPTECVTDACGNTTCENVCDTGCAQPAPCCAERTTCCAEPVKTCCTTTTGCCDNFYSSLRNFSCAPATTKCCQCNPGVGPCTHPHTYDLFITIKSANGILGRGATEIEKPRIEVTCHYPRANLWHTAHKANRLTEDVDLHPGETFVIPNFQICDPAEIVEVYVHDAAHLKKLAGYGELTSEQVRGLLESGNPESSVDVHLSRPDKANDKKDRGSVRLGLHLVERMVLPPAQERVVTTCSRRVECACEPVTTCCTTCNA